MQQGFTLFEILITLAIIAIIVTIAMPAYQNYTRRAHYVEIIQAAAPYQLAVTECYHILGDLAACHSGQHGIPDIHAGTTAGVDAIEVTAGHIKVIPVEKNGIRAEDDYILVPQIENDTLNWEKTGGGVAAGYAR